MHGNRLDSTLCQPSPLGSRYFTLRLPHADVAAIKKIADDDSRTMSAVVRLAIRDYLAKQQATDPG